MLRFCAVAVISSVDVYGLGGISGEVQWDSRGQEFSRRGCIAG